MNTRTLATADRGNETVAVRSFKYIGLTVFALVLLYPSVQVVRIALRSDDHSGATLISFRLLMADPVFIHWMTNTALLAVGAAVASVIIAAVVGYVLSRSTVRRSSTATHNIFVTQLLPTTTLLLLLYLGAARLGTINLYVGTILLYVATALPFCIWLLKRCYDNIPVELEDAAILEARSRSQAYRLVVLPLVRSALAVAAFLTFLTVWSAHFMLSIVLPNSAIFSAANTDRTSSKYSAATCLISIVPLVLFVILTRLRSTCRTPDVLDR